MPIDPDPIPGGNIRLDHTHTPTPIAHYIEPTDIPAYVSHFATCPNANTHRNR